MLPSHQRRQPWGDAAIRPSSGASVLDLVASGRRVTDLARDLGVSDQTIYAWRRQEAIDRGLAPGLSSAEREELAAAKRRIRELEAELAIHRRASELLVDRSDPKGDSRRSR